MKVLWGSALWLFVTVHVAMAKTLGQMTQDAERDLKLMTGFLEIVFYLLGVLVVVFGFFRVKKHMEQPQQVSLASAVVAIVVGGVIIAVPPIINGIGETFGISGGGGLGR